MIQGNPLKCGGRYSSDCFSFENGEWVLSENMETARAFAAAEQLHDGRILVTGGTGDTGFLNTAELLTEEGWEEASVPTLPAQMGKHCLVQINSTTVMAIGGFQYYLVKGKTFYWNFGEDR